MIRFARFIFILTLAAQPVQLLSRAEFGTLRGSVVLPAEQQSVSPFAVQLRSGGSIIATTSTDSAGNFQFESVRPGRYTIHVIRDGFAAAEYPADVAEGFNHVQIHLPAQLSTGQMSAPTTPGRQVVDLRQLSIPKKALNEYEKAVGDLRKGKYRKAMERLQNALKIAQDFYDAHFQLGLQYIRFNQPAEAEQSLTRAAELNPRVADPLVVLGLIYLQSKRFERAVEALDRAVDLDPGSARGFYYLGAALHETGELSRAERALKRSLSVDPTIHSVHFALARIYLNEERLPEALYELEMYLEAEPHAPQSVSAAQLRDQLRDRLQGNKSD